MVSAEDKEWERGRETGSDHVVEREGVRGRGQRKRGREGKERESDGESIR